MAIKWVNEQDTVTYELPKVNFPFAPMTEVLCRDSTTEKWVKDIFLYRGFYDGLSVENPICLYHCIEGLWSSVIMFVGNEHLLGTEFSENKLNAFDRVLVRNGNKETWKAAHFSYALNHFTEDGSVIEDRFVAGETRYRYCIPFEGNENLVGTR